MLSNFVIKLFDLPAGNLSYLILVHVLFVSQLLTLDLGSQDHFILQSFSTSLCFRSCMGTRSM